MDSLLFWGILAIIVVACSAIYLTEYGFAKIVNGLILNCLYCILILVIFIVFFKMQMIVRGGVSLIVVWGLYYWRKSIALSVSYGTVVFILLSIPFL